MEGDSGCDSFLPGVCPLGASGRREQLSGETSRWCDGHLLAQPHLPPEGGALLRDADAGEQGHEGGSTCAGYRGLPSYLPHPLLPSARKGRFPVPEGAPPKSRQAPGLGSGWKSQVCEAPAAAASPRKEPRAVLRFGLSLRGPSRSWQGEQRSMIRKDSPHHRGLCPSPSLRLKPGPSSDGSVRHETPT